MMMMMCDPLPPLTALVEYKALSNKTLQESIEREMSGNLEDLLVAIGTKDYSQVLLPITLKDVMHCYR